MKKKIKTKKFKTIKDYLETCSEDEREYIYDLYNNASVADLIDLLFEHLPADETIKEIEEYREELEWDDNEAKKSNKAKRKCDCDFVGCQGC
jgi:lipoate-protein ligase A